MFGPSRRQDAAGRGFWAQALVEFALALPIFLLVVYGLMETGRMIFTYSAVTTASREAVRYASAWGVESAVPFQYRDCVGIRNAAKKVAFGLNLPDTAIRLYYDDETPPQTPPPALVEYCLPGAPSPDTSHPLNTGDRVIVTVSSKFIPLLPLVPVTFQNISSGPSARTILGVIELYPPTPTPTP